MSSTARQRIDTVGRLALRLVRTAPTGRTALARIAEAIDPLWIPPPWGDRVAAELETARAEACVPIGTRAIERALRAAWGRKPAQELEELDPKPVAVTPGSQVHRGVVDGSAVAVKVGRPGLAAAVRQDLTLLDTLVAPLSAAFPALDPGALMAEVRERVLEELDLESEAETTRRFHRALRGHPFLTVPAPVTRLCGEGVLVTDWVQGTPIAQAPDRDQAAARLVVFAVGAARFGEMHADLQLQDVLILADGSVAVLDFGATRTVQPERVALAGTALEAFAADDAEALGAAAQALGWLPSGHGAAALALARHALGELAGPGFVRLDSPALIDARDRLLERSEALAGLMLAGSLSPEDLWPGRAVAQLFALITRVGATGDWLQITRAALREGWSAPAD